jgi:hypothetical protein
VLFPLALALALPLQAPDAPAAAPSSTILRVALQEPEVDGVPKRVGRVFASQLVKEIRKLDRTTAVSMDEMRALLEQEANRQLTGCDEGSCVEELALALGADELVVARLARVGGEHVLSVRRLDAQHPGAVRAYEKRFAARDGEEFLAAVGPAVEELWPDRPLARGAKRGVDKEIAKRLNPPPLAPGVFIGAATGAGALAVGGGAAAFISSIFQDQAQALLDDSTRTVVDGKDVVARQTQATNAAWVANGMFAGAGALAVTAGVTFFFTDFDGVGAADE